MHEDERDPQAKPAEETQGEEPWERREELRAAADAGRIGGPAPETDADEATRPLEEAGEGEAEGFEVAERELIEGASHGEQRWTPELDAFPPEGERDPAVAAEPEYGEPDEVDPTEVVRDPEEGPDDPGEGPGLAADR